MPITLVEPRPRPAHFLGTMVLIALALALLASTAWGASKPAAAPPAAPPPATAADAPQVYDFTEVIPRSERTLARMREIRAMLDADTSTDVIDTQLPGWSRELAAWWKEESPILKEGRSVQRVNDLAWELARRSAHVDRWKMLLAESGKAWLAEAQVLSRAQANWQATRAAMKPEAPPAVRQKIDEVLAEIAAVQRLYHDKSARLIAAQGRLTAQDKALHEIRREFDALRLHSARSLFAQDSRTLWTLLFAAPAEPSLAAQAKAGMSKLQTDARQLLAVIRADAVLHAVAFLGVLGLFLVLRKRSRQPGAFQPTAAEQLVLERSVFSALLLTLGLVPLLNPDQIPRILRLILIPELLSVLALAPAIVVARLRAACYGFAAIFLLDFLRNYLWPQWPVARLLLLSVSCLGAAGIAALLVHHRRHGAGTGRLDQTIHAIGMLCALIFLGSAVANLTGNVSLAEYLVSPPIRLVFLAIAIRLCIVVSTTLTVMALSTPLALSSRVVRERGKEVVHQLRRFIGVAGFALWAYLALFNLGLLASMQEGFAALMKTEWQVGAAVISVRDFVMFFLVLIASYLVSRVLRLMLAEEIFPRFQFPRGVPDAMVLLARYGVLLFGFLLALSSAGVDLSKVTLAVSALGVGIGFGLQNVVNNFVCGLILVFEHPIQVGDYIEVGPHYGKVTRIGFRSSMVLTRDGSEVVIPNAELIGSKVVNWSLSDAVRRISIPVPVSFGTDTRRMTELLCSVAKAHPLVHENPPPKAVLEQFGENGLRFLLHCWVRTDQMNTVRDDLALAIDEALREAGIQTPYQQIRIANEDAPRNALAPAARG